MARRSSSSTPGVIVPHVPTGKRRLASWSIMGLSRLLMTTWRVRWEDRSGLFQGDGGPLIFCIWHNRLAVSMTIYHGYVRKRRPANGLAAMISASRDGGLLADVLAKFGVVSVRGSSSRRGPQALLEATTWVEKGYHVAITPDGPRGPRYQVQEGIIALAQITGVPIVPVGVGVSGKIRTGSWDRFEIPLPLAGVRVCFGSPVAVPRDLTEAQRGEARRHLQRIMLELNAD